MAVAEEQNVDVEVVEYLKDKPDRAALVELAGKLEDPVADLVRKDSHFKKLGLDEDDYTDTDSVVDLLVSQPRLLQRPILVAGDRAIIGRPKSRVAEWLAEVTGS